MRIIGGKFKSKSLFLPLDKNTRPLRDFVKESIFNLIVHSKKINVEINNSIILDLFSGSGSFGLECISRGAKFVNFFENYPEALKILKKNISKMDVLENCKIIEENCFNHFREKKDNRIKYDIIFLDPPYKETKVNDLLENILRIKILKSNGILILHRHKKDIVQLTDKFRILDQRTYGVSKIILGS